MSEHIHDRELQAALLRIEDRYSADAAVRERGKALFWRIVALVGWGVAFWAAFN